MKFKNTYKLLLTKMFSVVTMAVYFHVSVPFPHNHQHEEDVKVSHDAITHLLDDCHNFVYHGAIAKKCSHHSHVSEDKIGCLKCHFFSSYKYVQPYFELSVSIFIPTEPVKNIGSKSYLFIYSHSISLRGPPVLV